MFFRKISSKLIINLNAWYKILKLLEDNIRENSDVLEYGENILDTPQSQYTM